jgi:hypothetical protein
VNPRRAKLSTFLSLPGSPADNDNLEVGDEILEVNGKTLEDACHAEVISHIHQVSPVTLNTQHDQRLSTPARPTKRLHQSSDVTAIYGSCAINFTKKIFFNYLSSSVLLTYSQLVISRSSILSLEILC